jgi:DNA-binding NarL/FixJ family response regulator
VKRILIADDHEIVRSGLRAIIESQTIGLLLEKPSTASRRLRSPWKPSPMSPSSTIRCPL